MSVEIIEFNGVKFKRYPDSKCRNVCMYFRPEKQDRKRGIEPLHREVWKFYNGPIPDGYVIHHVDGNSLNNTIENLECIPAFDHKSLHGKCALEDEAAMDQRREWLDKIRPMSTEKVKKRIREQIPTEKTCAACGKVIYDKSTNQSRKYCSNNCRLKFRRANRLDDVTRVCVRCGKEFRCNKYDKSTHCSLSCGMIDVRKHRFWNNGGGRKR